MIGYPQWYRDVCPRPDSDIVDYEVGPVISTRQRVTPKLLKMTWQGFPLHYLDGHGWGYLVPKNEAGTDVSNYYT